MKNIHFQYATVFVSSTFSDMLYERNLMMYHVLPKVKQWAFERGVIFDIVDLRWGINDQQAQDLHHTIKICLKRVQESDPIFLCFLGERYGWIPGEQDFHQGMFEKNIDDFKNLSATELEILQAMDAAFYESEPKACVFLFRKPLDFSGVPDGIKALYVEKEAAESLRRLKDRIAEKHAVIEYSAEFMSEAPDHPLHNFSVDDRCLEDALFERLTGVLSEKYHLGDADATAFDNELAQQQYHLKQMSLMPGMADQQDMLKNIIDQTPEFTSAFIGIPTDSALHSQIARFIMSQQSEGHQVLYRFIGIDDRVKAVGDVVTTLAYELSGEACYLEDLIGSLSFLKTELEMMEQPVLLIIAGLKPAELMDYILVLKGLKFTKIVYILETDEAESPPYYLDNTEESFKVLAEYLFAQKAKALTDIQLDRVVASADNDYARLKLTVTYLCTFAAYETLDQMILEISEMDKMTLTGAYLDRLAAVQNAHQPARIMENVLELLCNSPLPISRDDMVETICMARRKENLHADDIVREVDFSLAFARDYAEEHNGRFTVTDETVKTIMLFDRIGAESPKPLFVPKAGILIRCLRTVYMGRLYSDAQIKSEDAHNLCEIIKDYSAPDFRKMFLHTVVKETETFYKLAKALSKRAMVELLKTLSLQSMGHDVESYMAKKMKQLMGIKGNSIERAQGILREKLFSVSRKSHPENPFLDYYSMAIRMGEGALVSYERFADFISDNLSVGGQDLGYHALQLPVNWHITSANTTCYTTFDEAAQSYVTHCCYCENGFAIICDVLTGEAKKAYAIARDAGAIVATFYQNHTIHIIYEQGIITLIDLNANTADTYRFAKEGTRITWFLNDYRSGYQLTVANGNAVEIYYGLRRLGGISLRKEWTVLSVHGVSFDKNLLEKVVVIAKNEKGRYICCLLNLRENKTTFAYDFADNEISNIVQDETTGDIYAETDHGFSFVLKYNGGDALTVDLDTDQLYCAVDGFRIVQGEGSIYCNDELIVYNDCAICWFSSRKMVGFITSENVLYCIDNGY